MDSGQTNATAIKQTLKERGDAFEFIFELNFD
jgi:hypothetical protein